MDWFVLFVANVQTGFGPFISVYLTTQKWTQVDIGLILTVGSLAALVGQMPGGMVVDRARSERLVAGIAITAIAASALAFVAMPVFSVIVAAAILHSAASSVLGPAMAAISLGLVGHAAIGERLGRNARFASIGNGLAAAAMGACGYFLSAGIRASSLRPCWSVRRCSRSSPYLREKSTRFGPWRNTSASCRSIANPFSASPAQSPALDPCRLRLAVPSRQRGHAAAGREHLDDPLERLGDCLDRGMHCRATDRRRPVFALGRPPGGGLGPAPIAPARLCRAADPRSCSSLWWSDPYLLVAAQLLDGISGAVLAVIVTLMIADLTRGTGHFNLAQGIVGTATGIGASLSTTFAGYLSDHFGNAVAFSGLAADRGGRSCRRLGHDEGNTARNV